MAMDTKRIEEIAVNLLCQRINLTRYLSPFIPVNDKEPAWDGSIYIYKSARIANDNLNGRLPVQVKGHYSEDLSADEMSFSVKINQLKNYRSDGGLLYFVVYFHLNNDETDYEKRIYYVELPPLKLMHILSGCKPDQKETSIRLKTLPASNDRFASIALNCLENCRKQRSFSDLPLPTVDELAKQGVLEGLQTFVSGFGIESRGISGIVNGDRYLYAKVKGNPAPQPVEGPLLDMIITQDFDRDISVDGTVYYRKYKVIHTEGKSTVQIGGSLTITFPTGNPGFQLKYKASDKLRVLEKDLPFIIAVVEKKSLTIGDNILDLSSDDFDMSNFDLQKAKEDAIEAHRWVLMLDAQGCTDDLDLSNMTARDWKELDRLTCAVIDHQPISGLKPDLMPITRLSIGNLQFLLSFEHIGDDEFTYMVSNALDCDSPVFAQGRTEDEKLPVPVGVIYRKEDFVSVSNIQFERLLPSFQEFEVTSYIYDVANDVLLRMIAAYDEADGMRKEKLYETSLVFVQWLESMPDSIWDRRISILNRLQVLKRKRPLNEDERKVLHGIAATSNDRIEIIVGAYLLLDQMEQADYYLHQMPLGDRENFKKFPIFHFWKAEKEN